MNKSFFYVIILLLSFSGIRCTDHNDGLWNDNIHLSQKSAHVDANENSITISTRSNGWWVDAISFNDQEIPMELSEKTAKNFVVTMPEFTVERREGNQIRVHLLKNETGKERVLRIALQNGNYFDGVVINQGF